MSRIIESGDLTILDIETRSVSATVHVGENPGDVLLTPDGEYALAIDRKSGNVSVVRVTTVINPPNSSLAARVITKPLFTVFPTAPEARSAIIVPSGVDRLASGDLSQRQVGLRGCAQSGKIAPPEFGKAAAAIMTALSVESAAVGKKTGNAEFR